MILNIASQIKTIQRKCDGQNQCNQFYENNYLSVCFSVSESSTDTLWCSPTFCNQQVIDWVQSQYCSHAACSAGTGWVKNLGESRNKNPHFIGAETLKHFHFYFTDVLPTPSLSCPYMHYRAKGNFTMPIANIYLLWNVQAVCSCNKFK